MELFRKRKREPNPELTEELIELEPKQQEPEQQMPEQQEPKQEEPKQQEPKQQEPQQEEPEQQKPEQQMPEEQEPKQEEPKQEEQEEEMPKQEMPKQQMQQEPKQEEQEEEEPEQEEGEEPEQAAELTLAALLETMSPEGVEVFRKALAEAEIRGRNSAVEEHLISIEDSDGVPHPGCGQGASLRSRPASIFDLARQARE